MVDAQQTDFSKLLKFWNNRKKDFPNWHGIGVYEDGEGFVCFIGPGYETHGLQEKTLAEGIKIEVKLIPPFSNDGNLGNANKAQRATHHISWLENLQSRAASLIVKVRSHLDGTSLKSGKKVKTRNNTCRPNHRSDGCPGTIGVFLEFDPAEMGDPVWLLSAEHVLCHAEGCAPEKILDENAAVISSNTPFSIPSNPSMDIGLVRLDVSAINTTFVTPTQPSPKAKVMKTGAKTHTTHGQIVCACPVMDIGGCGMPAPVRGNLIMIKSLPNQPSFLDEGDSGALVTTEDGVPIAIIAGMSIRPNDPESPYGLATVLTAALPAIQNKIKDPSVSTNRTLKMFLTF